jgi:hypothetical protein
MYLTTRDSGRVSAAVCAAALLLCLAPRVTSGAGAPAANVDNLRIPSASSPQSRWYSLADLGISRGDLVTALRAKPERKELMATANIVDLRDRGCFPQLRLNWERTTVVNSEAWEEGIGPRKDSVGFPSVVRNLRGRNADGRYYLFYAIHDPNSGIGAATSASVEGPWQKFGARLDHPDSRVLRAPLVPHETSHFSSPVVIWNARERLWFMYFHFYSNEWQEGGGHQRTALATSPALGARDWHPWIDSKGKLMVVLPVTHERWMNSQSSYHVISRLPGGLWLAFLRGVGGEYAGDSWKQDPAGLGLAVSPDGRRWAQLDGNPWIHQRDGRGGLAGVYRPLFIAMLRDGYFLAWSESHYYDAGPELRAATSRDLRSLTGLHVDFGGWTPADGPVAAIRAGDTLYLFNGATERSYAMLDACAVEESRPASQEK